MYKPIYTITNKILNKIARIDVINDYIKRVNILPAWEKKLRNQARIKSTHFSTKIEGNRLTMAQVESISNDKSVEGAPMRDVVEVQNYFKVLDYVEDVANEKMVFNHDIILKMHYLTIDRILTGDLKGKYRIQQNVIKDALTGGIIYMPPEHKEVYGLMDGLVKYFNSSNDIHPVIKAGVSHYEFVRIHPFMDGNGRVARALATMVLYSKGYDFRKLFALEEYYEKDRINYYTALDSVNNKGDLTNWLEYFVSGMLYELDRVKSEIDNIGHDADLGAPMQFKPRHISALAYIRKAEVISNSQYRKMFHVSNKTAQTDLQMMVDLSILKIIGKGRSVKYVPISKRKKKNI